KSLRSFAAIKGMEDVRSTTHRRLVVRLFARPEQLAFDPAGDSLESSPLCDECRQRVAELKHRESLAMGDACQPLPTGHLAAATQLSVGQIVFDRIPKTDALAVVREWLRGQPGNPLVNEAWQIEA